MGLFVALIRRRELNRMKASAEFNLLLITQAKRVAQESVNDLMQVGTDYDSDSLVAKRLQTRSYQLKVYEEKLDEKKTALETQLQEINSELKSCEEMIQANIQSTFSYNVGGSR
jgi:septin family protein